ncbi:MAG: MFS transporter [Prevotella sp.]|nr:MFS transporter [Prevotella sp.]MBQ9532539.1 MFS transporter [Prevotella sp.]
MNKRNPWTWVPSLYFAEGLPYVIVMTVSLVLYKQMGLDNADITLYTSWLYLPWVIKPLWSPFVDLIRTKRWWIVSMQLLIGAALGGVAFSIPTSTWLQSSLCFFWLMAFASATHDIAADGFYMLGLDQHQQAFFVGIRSTFYRIATLFGQGVLIMIAGNLQVLARNGIPFSWALVFYGTAGLMIALWLWHGYILPKPNEDKPKEDERASDIMKGFADTIRTFFTKAPARTVVIAILFMLLYRMPEGLLVKISTLFLLDGRNSGGLGITPQELGMVQGTVGVIGLTLGGILGGIAAGRHGLRRWLWPMVCAITLPDIVYVYLSYALPESLLIINACVFVEQFGYGFGFTAYMLYLIYYCQGEYKTSHYALCTAFMALSMMIPGLFAGALQQAVGYQTFFLIVMAACAITFLVTAFIDVDPEFGVKKEK